MSTDIEKLARSTMKEPKLVEISRRGSAAVLVEQTAYLVALESKTALLLALLEKDAQAFERVLIFTRTRRGAERISHILQARDHRVNRIHADRTQSQRETALRDFRNGRARVLVALNCCARTGCRRSFACRGMTPAAPEDYVHRVGRTEPAIRARR
jgi:ATP-dependent RNA helicase RhlE